MDIERLTKVQIVLLTLLVSFVTSIATGIVTVSLMDQAPPSIAQTVNRVIERTVQTVAPAGGQAAASVVTQKTVIVPETELISQAVAKMEPSVVRIFTTDPHDPVFLGLGVILDASGTIATDSGVLSEGDAVVELTGGTRARAFVTSRNTDAGIAILTPATTTADGGTPVWSPVTIFRGHITRGQTIVVLAGNAISRVADGIVTAIIPGQEPAPQIIDTNIAGDSISAGSPFIDSTGNLVGVSTSVARASSASGFVSASAIMTALAPHESN